MSLSDSELSEGHEESSDLQIVDETIDHGVAQMLHMSADNLYNEYIKKNIPSLIDESIALYNEALASLSIPFGTRNAQKAQILYDLATAHLLRFDQCGYSSDLISSIKIHCNALCAVIMYSEDHDGILDGMIDGINRLHKIKEPFYLNQAVEYFRSPALFRRNISSADPVFVYICGLALYKRFQLVKFAAIDDLLGGILHLDRAIEGLRRQMGPLNKCLYSLACAHRDRFDHEENLQDLIQSIMIHRRLLESRGIKKKPHRWALYQSSLASCLERASLSHPTIREQYKRSLRTLALVGEDPIDEATKIYCAILEELPLDDILRPKHLLLNGVAQFTKYQLSANAEDLTASITSYKQALGPLREYSHSPEATQDYHRACYQLAIAMLETLPAHLEGDESEFVIAKVDESIALLRIAVEGEVYLCNELAKALFARAHRSGDQSFASEGIFALIQAISDTTQGPTKHLGWASHWIDFLHDNPTVRDAMDHHHQIKFLDYCLEAINMLRRVAGFDQTVNNRLRMLKASSSIPHRASAHAIALGHPQLGIEMLERGRAVFWSQALRLRDASREPTVDGMAKKLQYYMHMDPFIPKTRGSHQAETLERRREVEAFEAALDERLPIVVESYAQLSKSCKNGPVVVLVQGDRHSYAVLLQNHIEKPDVVTLPNMDMNYLQERYSVFDSLTRGEDERHTKPRPQPTERYEKALSKLWVHIVNPILSSLGLKKSDLKHRPRLWWCPSGLFTSLPLHAAGIYTGNRQDCVSNYVISSYATSLSSLIRAQDQLERPIIKEKVLIFAEPEPPAFFNLDRISHVLEEVKIIQDLVPEQLVVQASVPIHKDVSNPPSGLVVAYVPQVPASVFDDDHVDAPIVHFACHAEQVEETPLFSHFFVMNTRFTVGSLMRREFPNARFAFLSACQTATGDRIQSDESIHLASVMSFVGFPSIIGTMWPMNDRDGPSITKKVYGALFEDGCMNPDPNVIPIALDNAMRELRSRTGSQKVSARRWAPYIHIGA